MITNCYFCGIELDMEKDDIHTDEETGEDTCANCCAKCNPEKQNIAHESSVALNSFSKQEQ